MNSWVNKLLGWTDGSPLPIPAQADDEYSGQGSTAPCENAPDPPMLRADPHRADHHLISEATTPGSIDNYGSNGDDDRIVAECTPSCSLPPSEHWQIAFAGIRFADFESGLFKHFKEKANSQGFIIAKKTFKMDKSRAMELFGTQDIIQRGYLYCRSRQNSTAPCSYEIPFTFLFEDKEYIVKGASAGLYNHPVVRRVIDNVSEKRYESELSSEELGFMTDIGAYIPTGKLRRMMRWRFPGVDYSDDLMYRIRAKGRCKVFGSDPDAVNTFRSMGKQILAAGGVFELAYDASMRIEEIYVQCVGICAVYNNIALELISSATLAPRWRLCNHPLYPQCLAELGIVEAQSPYVSQPVRTCNEDLHMKLIRQIKCPGKSETRYRRLDEVAKGLVSIASNSNELVYRFTMNGLTSMTNAVKQLRHGKPIDNDFSENDISFGVFAPEKVEAILDDDRKLSRRVRKKRKLATGRHCSKCQEAGRSDSLGHRAYSSKCPLFEKREKQ